MKKVFNVFALSAAVSFSALSAYAEISVDLDTASQEEVQTAISQAIASGDTSSVAGLLADMAAAGSPMLESVISFTAGIAPTLMPQVVTAVRAVVSPEVAASVMATVQTALSTAATAGVADPAAVEQVQNSLVEQNQDLVAMISQGSSEVEPAAGPQEPQQEPEVPAVIPPAQPNETPEPNENQLSPF